MSRRFIHNARSSGLQLAVNQCAGLLIFYILSRFLNKSEFGELSWTLAVCLAIFTILPLGLDQVIVQKLAAGKSASDLAGIYFFHVLITGVILYAALLCCFYLFPGFFHIHFLLIFLAFGKLLFFFSMPFKQIATGLEKFSLLMYMSIGSSLAKLAGLVFLAAGNRLSVQQAALVFIVADGLELIVSAILYAGMAKKRPSFHFDGKAYFALLKECRPQAGVALFSSALARMDWILIGLFLTGSKLGEYSFAYKVFELSTLPLLMIAPLLLPLFSRYLKEGRTVVREARVQFLLKLELVIAGLTVLLLNVLWVPVMEPLTQGRYGKVNSETVFLLSLSIPMLYLNNFLWSIHFANGRLKMVLKIFALAFAVNLLLNFCFIPLWGNEGAALAFLISTFLHTFLYSIRLKEVHVLAWQSVVVCLLAALGSGLLGSLFFSSSWLILCFSFLFYLFLLMLQSGTEDRGRLRALFAGQKSNP